MVNAISLVVTTAAVLAGIFWVVQLLNVLCTEVACFESHSHKLLWFLVVLMGSIVGALWYASWRKEAMAKMLETYDEKLSRD